MKDDTGKPVKLEIGRKLRIGCGESGYEGWGTITEILNQNTFWLKMDTGESVLLQEQDRGLVIIDNTSIN